jgi:hypothetical protein
MLVEHYETKLDDVEELHVHHEQSFEASNIWHKVRIQEAKTIKDLTLCIALISILELGSVTSSSSSLRTAASLLSSPNSSVTES